MRILTGAQHLSRPGQPERCAGRFQTRRFQSSLRPFKAFSNQRPGEAGPGRLRAGRVADFSIVLERQAQFYKVLLWRAFGLPEAGSPRCRCCPTAGAAYLRRQLTTYRICLRGQPQNPEGYNYRAVAIFPAQKLLIRLPLDINRSPGI